VFMERFRITVKGDVQRVGYRDRVQKIARIHNISGWVQNTKGYDVDIIAEGSKENLQRFKTDIQISDGPIHVESIEITHDPYVGEFEFFEIRRGHPDEEMGERFDAAIHYLIRIDKNSQRSVEIGESMLKKQDKMLDKQDTVIALQKETIHEIKEMKHEVVHTLESRYVTIEHQLNEIRVALKKAGILD